VEPERWQWGHQLGAPFLLNEKYKDKPEQVIKQQRIDSEQYQRL